MNRLKKYDATKNLCFSVYPTTAKSLRSLSGDFGSIGRAIQVAVEVLYYRVRHGLPVVGSGLAAAEDKQGLKVPLTFSVLPRTKRLLEWLASEHYHDRNKVISSCEAVLSDLYTDYYVHRMTPAEREKETKRARREQKRTK